MTSPPTGRRAPKPTTSPPRNKARATVELQLAIGKSGVGVELARPAELACLSITELAVSLPLAKFPVDVSGGVRRFRHTRGVLERLTLELERAKLVDWLAPRARELLGEGTPTVFVATRRAGVTIGLFDDSTGRALAFEAFAMALDDDLIVSIANARGLSLPRPAAALAMRLLATAFGGVAERRGSSFVVSKVSTLVARAVLPDAGARAPDGAEMRVASLVGASDVCIMHISRLASPAEASAEAVRAREACELLRDADDALFTGDLERARALAVWALERAPRHPEVCRRIADLDRLAGGRAEAALGTLTDAEAHAHSGFLVGELAAESGEAARAVAALSQAADGEVAIHLAALALSRASELVRDHHDALALLDRAIARGPSSSRLRFARLGRRLAAGRTKDALADAEELEALAKGARAKHEVWRAVGAKWHEAGLASEAGPMFERALRYLPDDLDASAGLGATLIAQGKVARGVALLARAIAAAERDPNATMTSRWVLSLARALAEHLEDKPAAIARVRSIHADAPEAMVARGLEGRWRAALGDHAGAQVAYASLRELAATRIDGDPSARTDEVKALLVEAAHFERHTRSDLASAQAHLATALRLRPKDTDLEDAYREICAALAPLPPSVVSDGFRTVPPEPMDDEQRAEELIAALRARPDDDSVVDELATILFRLGRSHDLLALLSARLEDATGVRRERLLPMQITVLARLEKASRERGHDHEAQLFRDALSALGGVIDS